jgi:hypothetical protein
MLLKFRLLTFIVLATGFSFQTQAQSPFRKFISSLTDTSGSTASSKGVGPLYYEDHIYKNNIHTVQLYDSSYQLSSPIIQLGTKQQLKLSFDDLDGGSQSFTYCLIHCSSDWRPSELSVMEYISGFQTDNITDYGSSVNTLQQYTHYNLMFPNDNMKITKSGNYILEVYTDNNPGKPVVTKRFMVVDPKATIDATIKPPPEPMDRAYKQQVNFTIDHSAFEIENPFGDLFVFIFQNGRLDNAISGLKPSFVKDGLLTYNYDVENVFTGGNEFRNFDIKTLRTQTEHVQKITSDSVNTVYLMPEEKRMFKRYTTSQDINGKYLIKMQEASNSEREADYAYVHFFLPYEMVTDGNLYLLGSLTDWQFKKECQLIYNPKRLGYETCMYLKQGYYNYEYVFLKEGQKAGDETLIEGMHFETENDYSILVYFHAPGTSYDQLIAVGHFNSSTAKRN